MGSGISAGASGAVIGGVSNGVTAAAGTTSTNATLLPFSSLTVVTTGTSNQGVILPPGNGTADGMQPGDSLTVANYTGATIIVYPPAGGKLNNGSANSGLSLTNGKTAYFRSIDGTNFIYNLTA
jgi:hypothetical protein